MSAEHVAIVRRFVDAFNERDLDPVFPDLAADIVLDEWREAPGARSYRGPDAVRAGIESWFEAWEWMRVAIAEIVDVDERVLVTLNQLAKGRGSGVEVEITSHNVYTFEDGLVSRIQLFIEREPAIEAFGS
jgi:ketosteroid isomerase-like protein